jgi:uncharacterized membrane protein/predicted deacetylase
MRPTFNLKTTRNVEKIQANNQKRIFLIDLSRAVAVLLMIITHVIAIVFSHKNGASQIAFAVGTFGGTASFTLFLLLSGATSYITTINIDQGNRREIKRRRFKALKRTVQILLAYYLLAALSLFVYGLAFTNLTPDGIVTDILQIVLLLRVPEFTEFLVTFVVFSLSLVFFRGVYKFILKDYRILILSSAIAYFAGTILYSIDLGSDRLNLLKALFSGHENLHTFPFLQYFPVLLIGLYLGKILSARNDLTFRAFLRIYLKLFLVVLVGSLIAFGLNVASPNTMFGYSIFDARFPPQIGFILTSSAISLIIILVLFVLERYLFKLRRLILFIGKNALSFFVTHTALLLLFKYYMDLNRENVDWRFDRFSEILIVYGAVVLTSITLIFIKEKLVASYYVVDGYLNTHHYLLNFILPVVAIGLLAGTFYFSYIDNRIVSGHNISWNPETIQREYSVDNDPEFWYDHNFKYYQKINIEDLTSDQVFISQRWALAQFNHKDAVSANNLRRMDGQDIRVVEYTEDGFKEVPIVVRDPNTDATKAIFKFEPDAGEYYLFYGNDYSEMSTGPTDQGGIENAIQANLDSRKEHSVTSSVNRRWFLKDYNKNEDLNFRVSLSPSIRNVQYILYKVENTNLQGEMSTSDDVNYTASVSTAGLDPGYYTIEATVIDLGESLNIYTTYKVPFFVSYPLFTTWTLDWEGWGVAQYELNDIIDISSKYGMPVTHFFNPRIFIPNQYSIYSVDAGTAQYYVNWVKDRKNKGDQIALHLHYYADLLEEIGVEKRSSAQIVGSNRDETGLDAYSLEESEKILQWSIDKFVEKGLPRPTYFRSGGWMTSTTLLRALANKGFVVDSSGRTGGVLNPAWKGSTVIPWNLSATTMPYKPNVNNINSWDGERINIFEFPNNGADSYWFPTEELLSRFNQNYPNKGNVLEKPQTLTYLSHPHGFPIFDSQKIRGLFDYTGNYLYKDDNGPVVYSTLETAYNNLSKLQFMNGN